MAKGSLGSEGTTVFENILGIGAFVPWHKHEVEEVIIPFEGEGECQTEAGVERFGPGEVVIIPARAFHTVRSVGTKPLRLLAVLPSADVDAGTVWKDPMSSEKNKLEDANL
jgi:quercetin dioxygenase-like cupin family protein